MGGRRARRFNFLKLLILNDKNMKKEYVTPSLKVMKIDMNAMVMASGNAKEDVNWSNSSEGANVVFNEFENSNDSEGYWDF